MPLTVCEQYVLGVKLIREDKFRESVEALKQAYTKVWRCLLIMAPYCEMQYDVPFLKSLQNNPNALTLHRAMAAAVRGNLFNRVESHKATADQLHKAILLCDSLTPQE
ncbi:hypothetical protein HDU98_002341, partial [Podochytrium sp. JEL0797]